MATKSTRILILLAIDTLFFLLELIIGITQHSLALIADSYHMLNDVLSLCVGLWAVKIASRKMSSEASKKYTYGWQRAETLGALTNGVFLVALCVTIILEAFQRFADPPTIDDPMLVMIVGCVGLASNLIGLFLFHDHSHGGHGHSHGPGGHSHGSAESAAEEGHAHDHEVDHEHHRVATESGNIEDVLPSTRIAGFKTGGTAASDTTAVESTSPLTPKVSTNSRSSKARRHSRSQSRVFAGPEDIPVTPTAFRKSIIDASRLERYDEADWNEDDALEEDDNMDTHNHEQPLLNGANNNTYGTLHRKSIDHKDHNHAQPKEAGKGGHSHSDLNMRGIFLHVMGDALGNIGVIASAAFIWKTDFSWRYYADPVTSLLITVIILCSAIPLCKAASRILLQAVPPGIDLDHIKEDIEDLPGIVSCHHLHVWQLSDTKLVSSLHVQVDFDFKGEGSARYMDLAQAVRKCLHEYGIHSSTIQPEFCLDPDHDHNNQSQEDSHGSLSPNNRAKRSGPGSRVPSKAGSVCEQTCLLECADDCGGGKGCCDLKPSGHQEGEDHHDHAH